MYQLCADIRNNSPPPPGIWTLPGHIIPSLHGGFKIVVQCPVKPVETSSFHITLLVIYQADEISSEQRFANIYLAVFTIWAYVFLFVSWNCSRITSFPRLVGILKETGSLTQNSGNLRRFLVNRGVPITALELFMKSSLKSVFQQHVVWPGQRT